MNTNTICVCICVCMCVCTVDESVCVCLRSGPEASRPSCDPLSPFLINSTLSSLPICQCCVSAPPLRLIASSRLNTPALCHPTAAFPSDMSSTPVSQVQLPQSFTSHSSTIPADMWFIAADTGCISLVLSSFYCWENLYTCIKTTKH